VTDKQDSASLLRHVTHLAKALLLELRVADRQHFIHDEDLRLEVRGDRECQPQVHARGIPFNRCLNELLDFGKSNDLVKLAFDLGALHAEDGAVHVNILAACEFGVEACTYFEQGPHPSAHDDSPFGRLGDP
jgi:hypothetical protein